VRGKKGGPITKGKWGGDIGALTRDVERIRVRGESVCLTCFHGIKPKHATAGTPRRRGQESKESGSEGSNVHLGGGGRCTQKKGTVHSKGTIELGSSEKIYQLLCALRR